MKDPEIGDWWSYDNCTSDLRLIDTPEELAYAKGEIQFNHEIQAWEVGVWSSFDEAIQAIATLERKSEAETIADYQRSQAILHGRPTDAGAHQGENGAR